MRGNIYTDQRCFVCGGTLRHDPIRRGLFCKAHLQVCATDRFKVRFGRCVTKRFRSYQEAERFLDGLRFKVDEGTFDERDYSKGNPHGFQSLAETWLKIKQLTSNSPNTFRNINREIIRAVKVWGQRNIKSIDDVEIDDFLFSIEGISEKSRSNIRSVLHDFFTWACKRLKIECPTFPEIKYVLGWRNIVDIETQQSVLNEIHRISWHINPKIYIGIKWLSTYVSIRPNELRNLKERHIDVNGLFVIPVDKENDPKLVQMLDDDIELYKTTPKGLPDLYFFRHLKGNGAAKPGSQFGKDYLYKYAKKAMTNLGIQGVDLYGLTRHSTVTALGEFFSEDDLMKHGTTHKSNKAFRRYMQAQRNESIKVYAKARQMQEMAGVVSFPKSMRR